MSHLVLTGAGGRAGCAIGCAFSLLITSVMARSIGWIISISAHSAIAIALRDKMEQTRFIQ